MSISLSWDYDNNTATKWLRNGECNGCGECCRIRINLTSWVLDGKDYKKTDIKKGGKTTDKKGLWVEKNKHLWRVDITETLEHDCFVELGGKEMCSANKDNICNFWPMHPSHVECFNSCSYSFMKLDEWEIE